MSVVLIFSFNPPLKSNTSNPLIYIQVRTSAVFILFTAIWGSASNYYYYNKQNSVKKCQEEAKDVWWRLEWGLKNKGNESLNLQLDHKWQHCHHLVLFHFISRRHHCRQYLGIELHEAHLLLFSWELKDSQSCAEMRGYLYECI